MCDAGETKRYRKANRDPANGNLDVAKKLLSETHGGMDPTIKPLTSL
jgi:catalase (peroxidase I)